LLSLMGTSLGWATDIPQERKRLGR
jgi:hypothetical protein